MERYLYWDCNAGISGDMAVAALLDLGASETRLMKALKTLPLDGFHIEISRVMKGGIECNDFNVILDAEHENHDHDMKYLFENPEIVQVFSAREGDRALSGNIDEPFDIILTDMQMETDFLPLNAGEWLIKQVQFYPEYKNTKIVIISASPVIEKLAEKYGVDYIPKRRCEFIDEYKKVLLDK